MSMECQVNVKSQSELDIGGRETCSEFLGLSLSNASLVFNCLPLFLENISYLVKTGLKR